VVICSHETFCRTMIRPVLRSTSSQRRARSSPRREPVLSAVSIIGRHADGAAALKRMEEEIAILNLAGIATTPGRMNAPGTTGALRGPWGGFYLFWTPAPGVVAIRIRGRSLVPDGHRQGE
jgi:hypothetical protein